VARLSLQSVAKRFGEVEAVRAVDLEVGDGEFVVLVGPSGCGKSTLLRVVAGLEDISSGQIVLDGRNLNDVAPRDRDMAMVFQDYALYPQMTVAENLGFALKMRGRPAAEIRDKVARVGAMLEIGDYLHRKPKALSGGQRQRVALGRALIREPKVFLFDEPLSNLDAKLRVNMRMEIRKLQIATGTTSLYVTHDQVEAMTMADRIVVMRGGAVQQIGTPMELYRNPANAFVGTFIGSPPMSLVPAEVTAEGGRAMLALGPGARLELTPERGAALARAGAKRVLAGFRAETVRIEPAGQPDTIPAEVVLVEDHGADSIAVVRLGGREVMARVAPGAVRVGQTGLAARIDPEALHLFHPEDGTVDGGRAIV
jgi:ABC-type sugar transport system ATPase subunit